MNGSFLKNELLSGVNETAELLPNFMGGCADSLLELAFLTAGSLSGGGRLAAFGNGGSASDAQHLVAELVGRYGFDRPPLDALAFTVNPSVLTCVGNDYGYEEVFARQARAHLKSGDIAIGITTSGTSPNVVKGLTAAKEAGAYTVGLTGKNGDALAALCDRVFAVPSASTPRVQECHIVWIHAYCLAVEKMIFGKGGHGA